MFSIFFLIVLYTVINFGTKLVEKMESVMLDIHVIQHKKNQSSVSS